MIISAELDNKNVDVKKIAKNTLKDKKLFQSY